MYSQSITSSQGAHEIIALLAQDPILQNSKEKKAMAEAAHWSGRHQQEQFYPYKPIQPDTYRRKSPIHIHKYIIYTYIISYPTVYRFESIRPLWHWQPQQVKRSKAELEAMRAEMKELKARQMPWKMWADLKCGIFWEYHRRFKGMQYKYNIYIYTHRSAYIYTMHIHTQIIY